MSNNVLVKINKTFQARQYEPVSISIEYSSIIPDDENYDEIYEGMYEDIKEKILEAELDLRLEYKKMYKEIDEKPTSNRRRRNT